MLSPGSYTKMTTTAGHDEQTCTCDDNFDLSLPSINHTESSVADSFPLKTLLMLGSFAPTTFRPSLTPMPRAQLLVSTRAVVAPTLAPLETSAAIDNNATANKVAAAAASLCCLCISQSTEPAAGGAAAIAASLQTKLERLLLTTAPSPIFLGILEEEEGSDVNNDIRAIGITALACVATKKWLK